jgi:Uncharacterized conserved protein (DUF2249)
MKVHCTDRPEGSRLWWNEEGLHIDVRGLQPPEPMIAILGLIDGGEVEGALIAHLDREPIFLYPELDDRGFSHELVPACGGGECADEVKLRMVRWTR